MSLQIADAIGVAPAVSQQLKSGLVTAILAVSICGFTITALVVIQAMWRLVHRSMMWGQCCCSCGEWGNALNKRYLVLFAKQLAISCPAKGSLNLW